MKVLFLVADRKDNINVGVERFTNVLFQIGIGLKAHAVAARR